jgi:hypothetical protein
MADCKVGISLDHCNTNAQVSLWHAELEKSTIPWPHQRIMTEMSVMLKTTGISEFGVLISRIQSLRFVPDTLNEFKVFFRLHSNENGLHVTLFATAQSWFCVLTILPLGQYGRQASPWCYPRSRRAWTALAAVEVRRRRGRPLISRPDDATRKKSARSRSRWHVRTGSPPRAYYR